VVALTAPQSNRPWPVRFDGGGPPLLKHRRCADRKSLCDHAHKLFERDRFIAARPTTSAPSRSLLRIRDAKPNPPGLSGALSNPQVIKTENGNCCVVERTVNLLHIDQRDRWTTTWRCGATTTS
jgi:hypothetical protein